MKYYIYESNNMRRVISSDDDFEIIYSRAKNSVISSYINCFFTEERINKYNKNNYSYLGYGEVKEECFYRKKHKHRDSYIRQIIYDNNKVIIDTIDKRFIIDDKYNMKEI